MALWLLLMLVAMQHAQIAGGFGILSESEQLEVKNFEV
jgi:hypothetical protein